MNPFQYASATSPEEALALIGKNGRYLGGGIDLLGEMKEYIAEPDVLVDVKTVQLQPGNSDRISAEGSQQGGAGVVEKLHGTVTVAEIAADSNLQKLVPGLTEAAAEVGSPQIRNVATLAGNLLQHSRCWYYRQPDVVCLKRGGTTCYGKEGENKYLSLFTGNACFSPVVSNLATALTALEARVAVQSAKAGAKWHLLSMHELYEEAWKNPAAHHSLAPHDFLLGAVVPSLKRTRSAYRQISEKSAFDWALVSCAAAGNVTNGVIKDARVVLGAVAPVPYMVEAANQYLEGKPLNEEHASKAADLLLKDAKPLAQNGYKVPMAHALIRRTLLALNS